jgi:glycosyltransferase involved in cell wall biosynthesis
MTKKLVVFTGNTAFLKWTKEFETRIVTPPKSSSFNFTSMLSKGRWFATIPRRIRSLSKWADVVFVDFLGEFGHKVSQHSKKPIYIRIHRTELDHPSLFENVEWSNVKAVIGVSEHYGKLLRKLIPESVPIVVIPPGVDSNRWPFHPGNSGKLCTWSIPTARKRIYSLMLALREYQLHIGGYSAEDRILVERCREYDLNHILQPDVSFPEWQWEMEYYIHNALDESFGVAIAEAMLSGLIPFVHRIPCVLEFVPENLTYRYDEELLDLIEEYKAKTAEEKLELKKNLRQAILDGYTAEKTGEMMHHLFERT